MLSSLTVQLKDRATLTPAQVSEALADLLSETVPIEQKADFLIALGTKGETPGEIAAFAADLRNRSIRPELDRVTRALEILDVCGTGGDKLNTFNISTTVAFIAAAAGITVAKHGNRAITSQSGSADVLDALGIPTNLTPEQATKSLGDQQFAFFFAPLFHPAFKHLAPVRKLCAERGHRTIFNFLGPLLNPAAPSVQLLGVARPELCEPLAQVLQQLGSRRAMVVSGKVGESFLDEISTLGETAISEYYHVRGFNSSRIDPSHFALQPATLDHLRGGDRFENARIIQAILSSEDSGPKRDAVLLNAAAALFVAGKTSSLIEGWDLAVELIDSGKARTKLQQLAQYRP
jgi:anthranilate phosphoribosyltransferase